MRLRMLCPGVWGVIALVAVSGCADRPTAVAVRAPSATSAAELEAVKFWNSTATIRWNQRTMALLGLHPPANGQAAASRILTYLSIAQYRATLAAEAGKSESMHPSMSAAVGGASVAVLNAFFPQEVVTNENQLAADLASVGWPGEENRDPASGEAIGRAVGAAVMAQEATDNYFVASPGVPPAGPGYWTSAPKTGIVRSLYGTRPFFLTSADQLRPLVTPPAFGSQEFLDGLHEIRAISDSRTPEQTALAVFYAWGTAPFTAGNLNLIADQVITDHHRGERQAARVLAYANAAAFDAQISCFDAKFAYWFIRPTQADDKITLAVPLPNHPSFPSAHSCITGAFMSVVADFFPSDREQLESVIRDAGLSRMYGGLHYRFDVEAGQTIGRGAAALALAADRERVLAGDFASRGPDRDVRSHSPSR